VTKAAEEHPSVLLCEGTRVGQEGTHKLYSEMEVRDAASKVVSSTSKLVATSFYGRDIDRLNTFHSIAVAQNRKFVVTMKMALLLKGLREDIHLAVPNVLSDESILVYKKRKKTGAYEDKDYYKWERPFLEKAVDHKYVHEKQSKLIIAVEPRDFTELIDIRPEPGGHYIYSMSEPHSELEAVDERIQKNWLAHFQMGFHQIHASGHAPSSDLRRIINTMNPRVLIPIHTEHPERFSELANKTSSRIIIPEKSRTYKVP